MKKNNIYWNVLDEKRIGAFKKLHAIVPQGYYLAGGTALALQIGHRQSFDFDLFCNKEITFSIKRKILKGFEDYNIQTLVDTSDELTLVLNKEVKITCLNYYWPPVFALVLLKGYVPLLSIKDIAATKAYALGRRGNYRDYFDLYVILKNGYATLDGTIKLCQRKYGEIFSERMFLEQLTYIGDIEKEIKLKFLSEKYVGAEKLKKFFEKEIKRS